MCQDVCAASRLQLQLLFKHLKGPERCCSCCRTLKKTPGAPAGQLPPQQATQADAAAPGPAALDDGVNAHEIRFSGVALAANIESRRFAAVTHDDGKQLSQGRHASVSRQHRRVLALQRVRHRLRTSADSPAAAAEPTRRLASSPAVLEASNSKDWIGGITMSTVVIAKPQPQQMFQAEGSQGATVEFDGSKSTPELGAVIRSYSWTIAAEGTLKTVKQGDKVTVTLPPGSYTAQLVLETSQGRSSDTVKFSVEAAVAPSPPPSPATVPSAMPGRTAAGTTVPGTQSPGADSAAVAPGSTTVGTNPIRPPAGSVGSSSSNVTTPGLGSSTNSSTGSSTIAAGSVTIPTLPGSSNTTGGDSTVSPTSATVVSLPLPGAATTTPSPVVPPAVPPTEAPVSATDLLLL